MCIRDSVDAVEEIQANQARSDHIFRPMGENHQQENEHNNIVKEEKNNRKAFQGSAAGLGGDKEPLGLIGRRGRSTFHLCPAIRTEFPAA